MKFYFALFDPLLFCLICEFCNVNIKLILLYTLILSIGNEISLSVCAFSYAFLPTTIEREEKDVISINVRFTFCLQNLKVNLIFFLELRDLTLDFMVSMHVLISYVF